MSVKIAIVKERAAGETRVAATPETVRKLAALGAHVAVEAGAGLGSSITDEAYRAAGAEITGGIADGADIVLCVHAPDLTGVKKDAVVIGLLSAAQDVVKSAGVQGFMMEKLPRISRAQSMDVLSSQANLAGYRAVIEAAYLYGKGFPMMMTAAGTVTPAKVFVMGAGVAGLQAIATARRLGAVVSATDVRPAAKEQVESLGASFVMIDLENGEGAGGYARPLTEDEQKRQAALIAETLPKVDIVITTALIPGRPAPVLVTADMVAGMKAGSVLIDMAVAAGGNCPLSKDGDVVVTENGVKVAGFANLPARIAADASALYAKNLFNFVALMLKDGAIAIPAEDQLFTETRIV